MNDRVRAVIRKEWLDLSRNRVVMTTLIALPAVLTAMSCFIIVSGARESHMRDAGKVPAHLLKLSSDPKEAALMMMLYSALMMFSMVPVILPAIMAAHSIIGEKLSRSLEPLLATPLRTWELLLGKMFAIVIPALVPALAGYGVYLAVVHAVAPPSVFALATSPGFLLSVGLVGPLASILAVTFGMMISSRAGDLQSAQQLSGLIVLPVIGVGLAQTFGALSAAVTVVLAKALVIAVLDAGGLFLCISVFERETILSRWK